MTNPTPLAVITGASSGIGRATAVLLGARGWKVVLVARDQGRLDEVAREVQAAGGNPVVEACDASDGGAVLAMARRVLDEHGCPDVLVNSAGAGEWRFIEECPPGDARRMMDAPAFAAYNLTHAFMAPMLARRAGTIVHVGSPHAYLPWPGATAYGMARWALRGLHEALSADLHGTGVQTTLVLLGEVSSEYFVRNPGSQEHIPHIARLIRTITPEEAARAVLSAIDRPRHVVTHPPMLTVFYALNAVAPWLTRGLAVRTGRRH